ncbi:MAG TPA: efflux RND transporter permease subunit, partial [Minicystis sp.]|nr:efflux RND transporter permease subunit [Minicystis sp.]
TGQFQLRVRAPPGTRIERTEEIVRDVDRMIRAEVGPGGVHMTLANIGSPQWTYPVNAVYVFNSGPQEAVLLAALEPGRASLDRLEATLREKLAAKHPDVHFSFEAGDIVSQILNFGAPTPINVTIAGKNLTETRAFAARVLDGMKRIPELRDVQIPMPLDYPTLQVDLDRERVGQLGVSVDRVGRALVSATSSSVLTTPIFWTDPASGVPYRVGLRVPENRIRTAEDVANLPVMNDGAARPLLGDVATIRTGTTPGELDHYNSQRTLGVTANLAGSDLGRAAADVERAIAAAGAPPKGSTVTLHGQAEQMRATLASLERGLLLSIAVVLLLLAANFQSIREPVVVLATTPAVLAGVVVALFVTRSSLNVESLMGAIMAIGVSVANSLLLVTFAKSRWHAGDDQARAAIASAHGRLRPILMTSAAMIVGMVPTAAAIGEGAEQSAPLGRAVIGGLVASTVATLLVLPAVYVVVARRGRPVATSLDPDDVDHAQAEAAS